MKSTFLVVFAAMCPAGLLTAQDAETRHVLIITGVSGEPQYATRFTAGGAALVDAFRGPLRLAPDRVRWLAEDPSRDPKRINGKASKAEVESTLTAMIRSAAPGDIVVVILIGHGSSSTEPRFNLPGPDLTAMDFARLVAPLGQGTLVFVNAASASGDFVAPMSGPNRVVITATKTGLERNETLFVEEFVRTLAADKADTDKDGRVSVLEAFQFTTREVARRYETTNRLRTEHAMLDDDGDGKGSASPTGSEGDGMLARRVTFAPSILSTVAVDSALRALFAHRDKLQGALDALRRDKDNLSTAEYERRLEELLVELAETSATIRARTGEVKP